jgi:hypothetical protein
MPKLSNEKTIGFDREECSHLWVANLDQSARRCTKCSSIQVSEKEHDRRLEVWDLYYKEQVTSSPAYIACQAIVPHIKGIGKGISEKDKEAIKEILAAKEEHYKENGYIQTPNFPDPKRFRYEIV